MMIECPSCDAGQVHSRMEVENFEYGQGKSAVTLQASVKVYSCEACHFRYTDHEAEVARHNAVCRHLQLMAPAELMKIRTDINLSREEFADLSGLGAASIARWELGSTVQNKANDNYLFLLSFADNRARLTVRLEPAALQSNPKVIDMASQRRRFRGLGGGVDDINADVLKRAKNFELRKG